MSGVPRPGWSTQCGLKLEPSNSTVYNCSHKTEVVIRLKLSPCTCRHIYITLALIGFKRKNTGNCFNLIDQMYCGIWQGKILNSITSSFMKKVIFCELPFAIKPFAFVVSFAFSFFVSSQPQFFSFPFFYLSSYQLLSATQQAGTCMPHSLHYKQQTSQHLARLGYIPPQAAKQGVQLANFLLAQRMFQREALLLSNCAWWYSAAHKEEEGEEVYIVKS